MTNTLEGFLSIHAALECDSRDFFRLFIDHRKQYDREAALLRQLAEARQIPLEWVEAEAIRERASGNTHGGMIAEVGERRLLPLDDLAQDGGLVMMLDGVEDPFNFGYALRSLYAAGAAGLVIRPRDWSQAAAVIGRASAGASERIRMASCENAEAAADFFRSRGFRIACTAKTAGAVSLYQADLTPALFLLVGGEKRGITRSFVDRADLLIQIPYGREFDQSLGAVAAASVIAFEALRQKSARR